MTDIAMKKTWSTPLIWREMEETSTVYTQVQQKTEILGSQNCASPSFKKNSSKRNKHSINSSTENELLQRQLTRSKLPKHEHSPETRLLQQRM